MEKKDKIAIYQTFLGVVQQRNKLDTKGQVHAFLEYAEYMIKSQFDKGGKKNIKHKKKKDMFQQRYLDAYNAQSVNQKIQQYMRIVKYLKDLKDNKQPIDEVQGQKAFQQVYCLSYNLHIWKKKQLRLNMTKGQMYCQKDLKVKYYDLKNYLIRQSKNTDYNCFVLQAINTNPHDKSYTVRIGFKDIKAYKQCFNLVKATVIKMERIRIKQELEIPTQPISPNKQIVEPSQNKIDMQPLKITKTQQTAKKKQEQKSQSIDIDSDDSFIQSKSFISQRRQNQSDDSDNQIQSVALELLACDSNEEMYSIEQKQSQCQMQKKKNLDVFHQVVPDYDISSLPDDAGFELIHTQQNGTIFHHREDNQRYKIMVTVDESDPIKIFQTLARTQNYTKWNSGIQEVIIKSMLKSQNIAIIYQKHKPMSKIYRARDFVFMRHVFKLNNNLYVLDKSIENASYPPFITIVRGQLQILTGIIKKDSGYLIAVDIQMLNQGFINESQNHNLSMLYLKGFLGIQQYLKNSNNVLVQWNVFDLDWDITNKSQKKQRDNNHKFLESGDKAFKKLKKTSSKQLPVQQTKKQQSNQDTKIQHQVKQNNKCISPLNNQQKNQNRKQQISPQKIVQASSKSIQEQIPQVNEVAQDTNLVTISFNYYFDNNGLVIIPQEYLKAKYSRFPEPPKQIIYQQAIEGHPIWKGQWRVDVKNGGIIFINQQKINDQKGVIKFILSKIAKNLLSGKSVLNISLPVDIFGYQSNLERLAFGMTYAPIHLQKAAAQSNPIEQLKIVTGFGLTNSSLYLSMQKPFNSILGQTFQGWINGCPIYMQQISHHPPIAAFIFLGRGYKITGTLQSKVQVHMNSGCGTNDGIYRILLDDGTDFNFITPGGQISGISYGDRKFNLVGKYYVWSKKHRLFLDMSMDPCSKKGFLSKREHPTDYMQGHLKEVTANFLTSFESKSQKQRQGPSKSQTVKVICKASGTWHKKLLFEEKQYLDIDKQYPCILQYDKYLLPSDGNYRQDLAYRRKKDIVRAQTQKQRLQNLQRGDRKLRQKFHGKH